LPDDFMKQLQLSKQIEQKAKEATKSRKNAEDRMAEAEAEIKRVRSTVGDVPEADSLLAKANEAFNDKDYKNSLAFADKCIAAAKSRLVKWIEGTFGTSRELISIAQEKGKNVTETSNLLTRISEALGKGDIDEAAELSSEASSKAEVMAKEVAEEILVQAVGKVKILRSSSIDVSSEEARIEKVKALLDNEKFKEALAESDSLGTLLLERERSAFDDKIAAVRKLTDIGKSLGADIREAEGSVDQAVKAMKAKDLGTAMDAAEQARSLAARSVNENLTRRLESISSRSSKIVQRGIGAASADLAIEEGKAALASGDIVKALEKAKEAEKTIKKLETDIFMSSVSKWKVKLQIARLVKADIGPVSKEMDSAKEALGKGDLEGAIKRSDAAQGALERSLLGYQDVVNGLTEYRHVLSKATGLKLDVSVAKGNEVEARKASLQGDLKGSAALLSSSAKDIHSRIQTFYGQKVMKVEMDLAEAMRMQGDVASESRELDHIVSKVRGREYDLLDEELEKLSEGVDLLIRDIAERAIEQSRSALDDYDGPIEKSRPNATIAEAEAALSESRFAEAYDKALESVAMLKREESDLVESRFALSERLLTIMKELDCDSVLLNSKLVKAKELNAAGDSAGAVRIADEVVQYSTSIIKDDIQKQMVKVRKAISISKKKGINVAEADQVMKDAFDLLAKDKIEAAYEKMQTGMDRLKDTNRMYHDAYDMIADVKSLINEAYSKGENVEKPETRLEGAQSMFESGKYTEAINIARLAQQDIERQAAPLILPRIISECRDVIALGRMIKVNVSKAESVLASAEAEGSKGDKVKALNLVKEARDQVNALMIDALARDIAAARSTLEKDAESGMNTASAELMVEKADSLLSDRQLNDSWRIVELVKSELDQSTFMDTRALDYIDQAEEGIKDLQELGINSATAEEVLKQSKLFKKQGNFMLATELAKKAFLIAAEAAENIIADRVAAAEERAGMGEFTSQEMSPIVNVREGIKAAVSQHHFKDAMSMLPSLEEELQNAVKNREIAQEALRKAEKKVAETFDSNQLPEQIDGMLKKAGTSISEGSFVEARAISERLIDDMASLESMKEARMKEIASVREDLNYLGDDDKKKEISDMVNAAESFLNKLDLERTSLHLRRSRAALVEATGSEVGRRFEDLLGLYRIMDQFGIPKPPQEMHNGQMKMYDLKPKDLVKLRSEVAAVIAVTTEGLNNRLKDIKAKVTKAAGQGKSVTASNFLIERASSLISIEKFPDAIEAMADAERFIGVPDDMLAKFATGREELDGILDKMKENGIDVSELAKKLTDLERSLPEDPARSIDGLVALGADITAKLDENRPYIEINVDLLEQPTASAWTKMLVKVLNNGGSKALNIRVDIGEEIEVKGDTFIEELPAGESQFVRVEIRPRSNEKVTVRTLIQCESDIDHKDLSFESTFDVRPK